MLARRTRLRGKRPNPGVDRFSAREQECSQRGEEMGEVQCQIDSIRIGVACPERTLILRPKDVDSYLCIWISASQAEILADQLHGRPAKKKDLDGFLADNNAVDSDIECATIYLENNTFYARVLLSGHSGPYEVRCPIGIALALAVRADAPILVDEALFDRAGVRLS
jgi:uncharacterized protein